MRRRTRLAPCLGGTVLLGALAVGGGATAGSAPETAKAITAARAAPPAAAAEAPPAAEPETGPLSDRALAPYQDELLETAFRVATAIPLKPHVKTRARKQEAVVRASLELDQPLRAEGFAAAIPNWRRYAGYAELALYCARRGRPRDAEHYLNLALQMPTRLEDWRRDHIRVTMARAYAWLGRDEQAARLEEGVVESEAGKVAGARAAAGADAEFDEHLAALDGLLVTGNFDVARNALSSYAELYGRFYDDAGRRAIVEERIRSSWDHMPVFIRIEVLERLAASALGHGDEAGARRLAGDIGALADGYAWPVDYEVPLRARMAVLWHRAGDGAAARASLETALARFERGRDEILNIDRADTLLPVAAAWKALGDAPHARETYRRAVEEAVVNPNSRPRAEDLTAICCAMAVQQVEPDEALWARIREIAEGLDDPW